MDYNEKRQSTPYLNKVMKIMALHKDLSLLTQPTSSRFLVLVWSSRNNFNSNRIHHENISEDSIAAE